MSGKVWKLSGVLNILEILSGKCLEISVSLLLKNISLFLIGCVSFMGGRAPNQEEKVSLTDNSLELTM